MLLSSLSWTATFDREGCFCLANPAAGVALSNQFSEAKDVFKYVKNGWHVTLVYIVGFVLIMGLLGWQPHPPHKKTPAANAVQMESKTR